MANSACDRAAVYTGIVKRISGYIRSGCREWVRPWDTTEDCSPLRYDGSPFPLFVGAVLKIEAARRGYTLRVWMSARQAHALGGRVGTIERGITFPAREAKSRARASAEAVHKRPRSTQKSCGYTVFNVAQISGLPKRFYVERRSPRVNPPIPAIEARIAMLGAKIRHGGGECAYYWNKDVILMPHRSQFHHTRHYYSALAHELIHWTGHPKRLNRDTAQQIRHSRAYAAEEIIAEFGAAFLRADLLPQDEQWVRNSAAYIAKWLRDFGHDDRVLRPAPLLAKHAVDYIHEQYRLDTASYTVV